SRRLGVNHDQGQRHRECRSHAIARAFRSNRSSVHLYEMSHDGQSKTQTPVSSCAGSICLTKALKDVWKKLFGDTLSGVADHDFDVGLDTIERDPHQAAFGCKLDRVGCKVPDNLLQPVGIAGDGSGLRL